jgi:hypothetical protein
VYFYVGSAFTFVSRLRHGCCDTLLAVLRVFIVLICFCHRILLSCQLEHDDGRSDSYASVCCRAVKHIFGVSCIDMFLCNGLVYNAVSKSSYICI